MKSPIFRIISDYIAKLPESKGRFFLQVTKSKEHENKNFYKILLPKSKESLSILNTDWELLNHHISVYEDQTWSEKNFQSTYHYTGHFKSEGIEIIVHAYFDRHGNYCYCHVKDKKGNRQEIGEHDEAVLKFYAENESIQIISSISSKAREIAEDLESKYQVALEKLYTVSVDLIDETELSVKNYIKHIDICLVQLDNLETYSYNSCSAIRNHLELAKLYFKNKLSTIPQKENQSSKEEVSSESPVPKPVITAVKKKKKKHSPNLVKSKNESEKHLSEIEKINTQLISLADMEDSALQLITQYHLLEKKFTLLGHEKINSILDVSKNLNKTRLAIKEEFLVRIKKGDYKAVTELAQFIEDVPFVTYFECVNLGFCNILTFLVNQFKFNINQYIDRTSPVAVVTDTLLLTAVRANNLEMVTTILELGANPNLRNLLLGTTSLMEAVNLENPQMVSVLLKYKADVNARMVRGKCIVFAFGEGTQKLLQNLKEKDSQSTALHFASEKRNAEIAKLLLANGADHSLKDARGFTASLMGMMYEDHTLLEGISPLLLEKGADVDDLHPDFNFTGLFFACQKGRIDDVKYLVQLGANPNLSKFKFSVCVRGAVNISDEELFRGKKPIYVTPLMKAAQKGYIDIIKFLITQKYTPVTEDNIYNSHIIAMRTRQFDVTNLFETEFPDLVQPIGVHLAMSMDVDDELKRLISRITRV